MAKNPVTVTPDIPVDEAASAMKKGHFRRLPVVENGKLVGFLSDKDIMRVAPSPATTLSRYEARSLLAKLKIRDIMSKEVISVNEDATIEEAALIMYNNKIGGLPVVSSVGAVVGVITETDIFKTFVDVMGLSIDSLVTCRQPYGKYEIVVRGNIPNVDEISEKIKAKGYEIIHTARIG
jgi:acetoin utilization protein AcuB